METNTHLSLTDMEAMAKHVADSGMFGITKPSQAVCLFMLCKSEGIDPISALKRYHLIEGKPSMRADAMQAEFLAHGGGIIFHVRSDDLVAATFFADVEIVGIDDEAQSRGVKRFDILWALEFEKDLAKRGKATQELAKLSRCGEETIFRSYADCEAKGLTSGKNGTKTNWASSPRQMLTARVLTEGIRLVNPGLVCGVYTPDEISDIREEPSVKDAGPSKRDKKAMQAIVAQHQQEALETKDPERRREVLGLAADIKLQLEEDEIPMTHASDPAEATVIHEPVASVGELVHKVFSLADEGAAVDSTEEPVESKTWRDWVIKGVKSRSYFGRTLGSLSLEELKMLHDKKALTGVGSPDREVREESLRIIEGYAEMTKGGGDGGEN